MGAPYTYDVFTTLDGFGSPGETSGWGAFWGKDGPEFLAERKRTYGETGRMVFGGNTFRLFTFLSGPEHGIAKDLDPAGVVMRDRPTYVVSNRLEGPQDWPDATVLKGDAVEIVRRLKEESDVPIRSHGSISLNRSLMAAGLIDFVHVSIIPVISGRTGDVPVFQGMDDFDLELIDSHTFDSSIQQLIYRPTAHRPTSGM